MIKILIVGQTPPPHGGQAVMIGRLLDSALRDVRFYHVRMAFSHTMGQMGRFRFGKLAHLASVIARIVWHRVVHGVKILYFPPGGPERVPMLRDLAILLSTRWMFSRTILHFHASGVSELYPRLSRPMRWLFRRAYFHADAAIRLSPLSPPDAQRLEARREFIIPNGIDDASLGVPVSREGPALRMLFVGVLRESKGVLVLLDACRLLSEQGVDFQAELVGDFQSPEFEAQVRGMAAQAGIEDRVRFSGVLLGPSKWAAYARANLFVFPSHFESETLPVVLLEAMAFGLPAVATRWRGIPALVDDGRTGLLVPIRDPQSLADRLGQLAANPALMKQLGAAARERFLREYLWQRHQERMEAMFHAVAGVPLPESAASAALPADCAAGGVR